MLTPVYPARIVISGGEPFLFPQIVDLLQSLRAHRNLLIVSTNGCANREAILQSCPYIHWLDVSIHGSSPEQYYRTRGQRMYRSTVDNIAIIRKRFPELRIAANLLVHRENVHDLQPLLITCKELGIQKIRVANLMVEGRAKSADLQPISSTNEYQEVYSILRRFRSSFDIIVPPVGRKRHLLPSGYLEIDHNCMIRIDGEAASVIDEPDKAFALMSRHLDDHFDLFGTIEEY